MSFRFFPRFMYFHDKCGGKQKLTFRKQKILDPNKDLYVLLIHSALIKILDQMMPLHGCQCRMNTILKYQLKTTPANNWRRFEPPRMFGKLLEPKIRMLDVANFFDIRILRKSFARPAKTHLDSHMNPAKSF